MLNNKDQVSPALEALADLDKSLSQERKEYLLSLKDENWEDETTIKIVNSSTLNNRPFTITNYPATYGYLISFSILLVIALIFAIKHS